MDSRAQKIFEMMMDCPAKEWPEFIERSCLGDEELKRDVQSLVDAYAQAGDFLKSPTGPVAPSFEAERAADAVTRVTPSDTVPLREGPGSRIGTYRILEVIGQGGFGTVFLAEQQKPIQRLVAIKIIKLGMDTRQVIARFEQERQALALMNHPNIAGVLDAGATESGRPYFVMELVKGEAMTSYCDRYNVSIEERLRLFVQVCHAVQHAHQKGVIHRDIKPSNIIVSTRDGQPFAKIIDFGIAKATSGRLTDLTLFTEHHMRVGTPEYMSPEHAEGSLDIDTRSDIYSLGVLLYELLTGETPFDAQQLRAAGLGEMQRIIREQEPLNPSRRLSTPSPANAAGAHAPSAGPSIEVIAKRRRTDPRSLLRFVRGELDWIVMKCLEKDRGRRYETAKALADDIERHLSDQPVVAGPPSAAYKARKFVRRHRTGVVAGTLVAATLVLGLAGTAWAYVLRTKDLRMAEQAQKAAIMGTKQFGAALVGLAASTRGSIASEAAVDPLLSLHEWVGTARLSQVPLIEIEVRQALSLAFESLNRPEEGRKSFEFALAIAGKQGWSEIQTESVRSHALAAQAESIMVLAELRGEVGDWENATAVVTRAIESVERSGRKDTRDHVRLRLLQGAGLVSQNRYNDAVPVLRQVVNSSEKMSTVDKDLLGESQYLLSAAELLSKVPGETPQDKEARETRAETLAIAAKDNLAAAHPGGHRKLANAMGWVASVHLRKTRDAKGAMDMLQEAAKTLGPSTRDRLAYVKLLNNIGYMHLVDRSPDLCRAVVEEAVRIGDTQFPEQNAATCQSHFVLAVACEQLKDEENAEIQYQFVRRTTRTHPEWIEEVVRNPRGKLAEMFARQGRHREAQEILAEVVRLDAETGRIPNRLQSATRLLNALGVGVNPPRNQAGPRNQARRPADASAIARCFESERDRLHAWVLTVDVLQTLDAHGAREPEGFSRDELLASIREANNLLDAAFAQTPGVESTDLVAATPTLVDELCQAWEKLDETESSTVRTEWQRRFAARSKDGSESTTHQGDGR